MEENGCSDKELPIPTNSLQQKFCTTKPFPIRGERKANCCVNVPVLIALVGLPARGKTYISRKLARYLNWIGITTKVFNVGEHRRHVTQCEFKSHEFFNPNNEEAQKLREQLAIDLLDDACRWLEDSRGVAVYDATNSTRQRRELIYNTVTEKMGFKVFFVESVCDDPEIIDATIREIKINSPDYIGKSAELAVLDFQRRIEHYESCYETLDEDKEDQLSFMKIYNAGQKLVIHRHKGHIEARVVYYLMNTHILPRTIYFSRHGESIMNIKGLIGGDSNLTERGIQYAKKLGDYINSQEIPNLQVWTSWMKRTIQTAEFIDAPKECWKSLNEIDAGICEEMSYEDIQHTFPKEFAYRDEDKFHYRYPRGESYEDLVARLEPVIMELERQRNVLVISHQAVIRCLLAYFMEKNTKELPYLRVPLHSIIRLNLGTYACDIDQVSLDIEAVDTHRDKPLENMKK